MTSSKWSSAKARTRVSTVKNNWVRKIYRIFFSKGTTVGKYVSLSGVGYFGQVTEREYFCHGDVVECPGLPRVALRVVDVTSVDRDRGEGDLAEGHGRKGREDGVQPVLLSRKKHDTRRRKD